MAESSEDEEEEDYRGGYGLLKYWFQYLCTLVLLVEGWLADKLYCY